jgi:1,4-alpha-glucan branching enzyme
MKNLLFFLSFFSFALAKAQIVKITPSTASVNDKITIFFDATQGTGGLVGASSVYMHSGLVTEGPEGTAWQHVQGNWGQDDGVGKMSKVEGEENLWQITLSPSARDYYKLTSGEPAFRLSMVFRNADGSKEGKGNPGNFQGGTVAGNGDIYIDLSVSNFVQITEPQVSELFVAAGHKETFRATASGIADQLTLLVNSGKGFETLSTAQNQKELSVLFEINSSQKIILKAEAVFGTDTQSVEKEVKFNLLKQTALKPLTPGLKKGINYHDDQSKVTLVLEAPQKDFVYVVGDFTNWEIQDRFLMNQTPDGELFWLEVDQLTPGTEYVFQYWVNGVIKIGDPYADKIADPWNDAFIPQTVYPNLPPYIHQDFGVASVLQTAQPAFEWAATEDYFERPDKNELVIYELLIRDFIGSHDYKDLKDTLSYLKRLGVNAIELMPIMEFEGNESWGYNPSYFFAPDKYYGSKNDLKMFIQKAHQEGFAVILDMVLNHAFGQNAMVKMYWDNQNNRPAANSPWFNTEATHPFNVGYDFNHESLNTQAFVDSVNAYWLSEYHFDGYRFDLSKGFTQKRNTDVGRWSARDDSRIALLKRMAGKIRKVDKNAYIILEHFADASEENELKADGMMVWGNNNHDFAELMKGNTSINLSSVDDENRVSYMESHDEQRQIYRAKNAAVALKSTYDPRNERVALNRLKMMTAFFYLQPGPKLMWQFQELGYDIDINFNGRVGNKPLVWGPESLNYYIDAERQSLYKTHAAMMKLANQNKAVLKEGQMTKSMSGSVKSLTFEHENMDVAVIGNFDIQNASKSFTFPQNGWWFDYFQKDSINVSGPVNFEFSPGEFHVFTSQKQAEIEDSLITFFEARDTLIVRGPVVTVSPEKFQPDTQITITFNSEEGTAGLVGENSVYMHSGIITNSEIGTDWQYVVGNWGQNDGIGQMTRVAGQENKWQITLTPESYYSSVPANADWYRIGMVFRNADGSREGKSEAGGDIFVNFSASEEAVLSTTFESLFTVFPNPTQRFITVESKEAIEAISLIDFTGKIRLTNHDSSTLDLKGLSQGIYILNVKTKTQIWKKKIVIH